MLQEVLRAGPVCGAHVVWMSFLWLLWVSAVLGECYPVGREFKEVLFMAMHLLFVFWLRGNSYGG